MIFNGEGTAMKHVEKAMGTMGSEGDALASKIVENP